MFGRSARVSVGDRFVKVGQSSRVFMVVALDERPGRPPHAFVSAAPGGGVRLLIAVSALTDPDLFRRL